MSWEAWSRCILHSCLRGPLFHPNNTQDSPSKSQVKGGLCICVCMLGKGVLIFGGCMIIDSIPCFWRKCSGFGCFNRSVSMKQVQEKKAQMSKSKEEVATGEIDGIQVSEIHKDIKILEILINWSFEIRRSISGSVRGAHYIIFLTHLFPKGRQLIDMKDQPSPWDNGIRNCAKSSLNSLIISHMLLDSFSSSPVCLQIDGHGWKLDSPCPTPSLGSTPRSSFTLWPLMYPT